MLGFNAHKKNEEAERITRQFTDLGRASGFNELLAWLEKRRALHIDTLASIEVSDIPTRAGMLLDTEDILRFLKQFEHK